jgi:hypothetical protein
MCVGKWCKVLKSVENRGTPPWLHAEEGRKSGYPPYGCMLRRVENRPPLIWKIPRAQVGLSSTRAQVGLSSTRKGAGGALIDPGAGGALIDPKGAGGALIDPGAGGALIDPQGCRWGSHRPGRRWGSHRPEGIKSTLSRSPRVSQTGLQYPTSTPSHGCQSRASPRCTARAELARGGQRRFRRSLRALTGFHGSVRGASSSQVSPRSTARAELARGGKEAVPAFPMGPRGPSWERAGRKPTTDDHPRLVRLAHTRKSGYPPMAAC